MSGLESAESCARVAAVAAHAGATGDALRIWQRAANLNLSQTRYLEELLGAGLEDALTTLYCEMQETMPASVATRTALQMIEDARRALEVMCRLSRRVSQKTKRLR